MPASSHENLEVVVNFFAATNPNTILDIGVGFGKIGYLAREFLDVMIRRTYRPEDWAVRIDGIEAFPDYIREHQRAVYNDIYIGDAFEVIDRLGNYDVVVLGDCLEHFKKETAFELLDKVARHSNKWIFLFIPIGEEWEQDAICGNEYERHLSFWEKEEIEPFALQPVYSSYQGVDHYGRYLILKDDYIHFRTEQKVGDLYSEKGHDAALSYLKNLNDEKVQNLKNEYLLVDFLLQAGKVRDAVSRLHGLLKKYPQEASTISQYLDQLNEALAGNL